MPKSKKNIVRISSIPEEFRDDFVVDLSGKVPMPGDVMRDFNFDWGPLKTNMGDSVKISKEKKFKRKKSFELACSSNANIAYTKHKLKL